MHPATTMNPGVFEAPSDVCKTKDGAPVSFQNKAHTSGASGTAETVTFGGSPSFTTASEIPKSTGDEEGAAGPGPMGKATCPTADNQVFVEGSNAVTQTSQGTSNDGNAQGSMQTASESNVYIRGTSGEEG